MTESGFIVHNDNPQKIIEQLENIVAQKVLEDLKQRLTNEEESQ